MPYTNKILYDSIIDFFLGKENVIVNKYNNEYVVYNDEPLADGLNILISFYNVNSSISSARIDLLITSRYNSKPMILLEIYNLETLNNDIHKEAINIRDELITIVSNEIDIEYSFLEDELVSASVDFFSLNEQSDKKLVNHHQLYKRIFLPWNKKRVWNKKVLHRRWIEV